MAAVTYTKARWVAEADIQRVAGGAYQGIVLLKHCEGDDPDAEAHTVEAVSETPTEALEEAKALAHRLLGELD